MASPSEGIERWLNLLPAPMSQQQPSPYRSKEHTSSFSFGQPRHEFLGDLIRAQLEALCSMKHNAGRNAVIFLPHVHIFDTNIKLFFIINTFRGVAEKKSRKPSSIGALRHAVPRQSNNVRCVYAFKNESFDGPAINPLPLPERAGRNPPRLTAGCSSGPWCVPRIRDEGTATPAWRPPVSLRRPASPSVVEADHDIGRLDHGVGLLSDSELEVIDRIVGD